MPQILLPAPLDHQQPAADSPARFKLLHPGRRWGKDRLALTAAIAGHGPVKQGVPKWPGAAQKGPHGGWWVGWVVRDFTQGSGIWREEFLPRFSPAPNVQTNRSELRITLPNGGGIFLCTAENINSLRGLGKRMAGVVINEAAWFDLETAWLSVLRPVLVDNKGWAIMMSTPNSGLDGNQQGVTPSYFNRLCLQARTGELGTDYAVWGGDLRDNPTIDPDEALAFIRSYPDASLQQQEEVYGLLVSAGAGLAFPAWSPVAHYREWTEADPRFRVVLGMDWGIRSDSVVLACVVGDQGQLTAIKEWTWQDKDAYDAGYDFAQALMTEPLPCWPEWMTVDSAMAERTGVGGTTILSEFQAGIGDALKAVRAPNLPILPAPKGPGSRAAGYNQITKMLAWGPALADGTVPASRMPLFQIMRTRQGDSTCPMLAKDLATAILHPKHKDDVDKDRCGFHAGDALMYLLAMVLPKADRQDTVIPVGVHPGWLPDGRRRSRVRNAETEREELKIVLEHQAREAGVLVGGRAGVNPRRR